MPTRGSQPCRTMPNHSFHSPISKGTISLCEKKTPQKLHKGVIVSVLLKGCTLQWQIWECRWQQWHVCPPRCKRGCEFCRSRLERRASSIGPGGTTPWKALHAVSTLSLSRRVLCSRAYSVLQRETGEPEGKKIETSSDEGHGNKPESRTQIGTSSALSRRRESKRGGGKRRSGGLHARIERVCWQRLAKRGNDLLLSL